jgi:hypothetical protein
MEEITRFLKKLEKIKYYGTLTISLQAGKITVVKPSQTIKLDGKDAKMLIVDV